MTAISVTIKQYFIRKGDEKTNKILLYVPYNLREKPKDKLNFDFINSIAVFPVSLDLVNEFKTGVKKISEDLRPLRTTFVTYAMFYIVRLSQYFPFAVSNGIFLHYGNRTSLLTTNVKGPSEPYHIAGAESLKCTTFMPNLADIPGGFAIVSHRDVIWISFNADRYRCDEAKDIIKIFEDTMDSMLKD